MSRATRCRRRARRAAAARHRLRRHRLQRVEPAAPTPHRAGRARGGARDAVPAHRRRAAAHGRRSHRRGRARARPGRACRPARRGARFGDPRPPRAPRARLGARGRARASAHRDPRATTPTSSSPTSSRRLRASMPGSRRSGGATNTAWPMHPPAMTRSSGAAPSRFPAASTSLRWMPRPGRSADCTISPPTASRATRRRRSARCSSTGGRGATTACSWRRCRPTRSAIRWCVRSSGPRWRWGRAGSRSATPQRCSRRRERTSAFTVMPAKGLTLTEVGYPDDHELEARAGQTRARRELHVEGLIG